MRSGVQSTEAKEEDEEAVAFFSFSDPLLLLSLRSNRLLVIDWMAFIL